jgi:hypothetical protein
LAPEKWRDLDGWLEAGSDSRELLAPRFTLLFGFLDGMRIGEGKPLAVHLVVVLLSFGHFRANKLPSFLSKVHHLAVQKIGQHFYLKPPNYYFFVTLIFLEKWVLSLMAKQMIKNFKH